MPCVGKLAGGSVLGRLLRDPMGAMGLILVLMFLTMALADRKSVV